MDVAVKKRRRRARAHRRVRKKIFGTPERLRLCVFRSGRHIYGMLVDDERGHTLAAASTLSKDLKGKLPKTSLRAAAREVGKLLAARALGVGRVAFDRGGYKYHGRVKDLAEGAREGGLKF